MGQYFMAINKTKRQYVCPYCIGGVAKLCEWALNDQAGVLVLLLRQSFEGGGGDYHGDNSLVGSWVDDQVAMVGDYDQSGLYETARHSFENISLDIGQAYNTLAGGTPKLDLGKCDTCRKNNLN